jgi:hypothetical protein
MDITYYFSKKGQKFLVTTGLIVSPMIDTLQVKLNLNELPGGGNTALCSNASGSGVFHTRSFRGIVNDANSYIINTADGTWTPAVCAGTSGYFYKQWSWEIDSITASQCNVNGNFYIKMAMSIECLRHPVGSAPYIAAYYNDGVFTWPHKYDFPASVFEMKNTKRVDAQFSNTILNPGYLLATSSTNVITTGFIYLPTNYHDSVNCDKLGINLFKKVDNTWVFVKDTLMSPYWDVVDDVNTGQSRTDETPFSAQFIGLQDTSLYKLEFFKFKNGQKIVEKIFEIWTKKLYTQPSIENIVVNEVTHNTAKVTLTYYLGNTNATPLELSVLGASGSMFTRSFNTAGIPGTLTTEVFTVTGLVPNTAYAVHPKKDAQFIKPIVPFTTLPEPIVITTVDPWSWTADAVTGSPDGLTAIHTIRSTVGNDGAGSVYILITNPNGNAIEKTVVLDAATKQISIDGLTPGMQYAFKVYYRPTGKPEEFKGSFSWKSAGGGGGTVGINSTDNIAFSVYPNPTTDIINIKGLEKSEKVLYDRLGQKVLVTTENAIDVKTLPAGLYFLQAGEHRQKIEKQ